jgi:GTPase
MLMLILTLTLTLTLKPAPDSRPQPDQHSRYDHGQQEQASRMSFTSRLRELFRRPRADPAADGADDAGASHLSRAAESIRGLLRDPAIPAGVRRAMAEDYAQVEAMLERLEQGELQIAVFGRVSVGKSAVLNALAGRAVFEVGVLHGTTQRAGALRWEVATEHGVQLVDTPGINELSGEERERLAEDVARHADLVLFVVDADLTAFEVDALRRLAEQQRPLLLVLNKADRYTPDERAALRERLLQHAAGLVRPENVVEVMAQPAPQTVLEVGEDGHERETRRPRAPDVEALRARVLAVLEAEGKTLLALNASLFAGQLADAVGERLTALRREAAERIVRLYCVAKGVTVALNPVPVADLLAAASLDVALVVHLSKVYGLPMTKAEAGGLLGTIVAQLAALMGAIWGVHLVASALKLGSAGLSTALTAGAQGALAWYATVLVGRAAERYLAAGKSWGEDGPKRVVREIVDSLDRDSILREAREEILRRLRGGEKSV